VWEKKGDGGGARQTTWPSRRRRFVYLVIFSLVSHPLPWLSYDDHLLLMSSAPLFRVVFFFLLLGNG
jgi:hypothetical protein